LLGFVCEKKQVFLEWGWGLVRVQLANWGKLPSMTAYHQATPELVQNIGW